MSQIEGKTPRQLARDAWAKGDLWKAKGLIERALETDPTGAELAHTRLTAAEIYRRIGDLYLAERYLSDLTAEWDRYPDVRPLLEGYAFYALALVKDQRREHSESVRLNLLAAEEFAKESMRDHRRRALQNAAWSMTWLGDTVGAIRALDTAWDEGLIRESDQDAWWQHKIGSAFVTYAMGSHDDTIALTADILRKDKAAPDVQCEAAWLAGRAYLALGNPEIALQLADIALKWAIETSDSRCMNDTQRLRREIAEAQTQENEGA